MKHPVACLVSMTAIAAAMPALAQTEAHFNRIASFPVTANLPAGADPATPTSAEIIAASGDGMTLAYSDSPNRALGFIDITEPSAPRALGSLGFDGEPTAVSILGQTAFVGVNTSASYAEPSGRLAAVDLSTRSEIASCELGGQPDSTAIAPDGSFVAVAVENERDEDLGDGGLPQMPAGYVAIVPLVGGAMDCGAMIRADVTGLAEIFPEDPEPEFVDVNAAGEIVVTLQENNHIVILGPDGAVRSHFPASAVDLEGIDLAEDGAIDFTGSQPARLREPDGVQWIGADHIATANEATGRAARAASPSSAATARSSGRAASASNTRSPGSATIPRPVPTPRAWSPRAWSSPASAIPTSCSCSPSAARSRASTGSRTACPSCTSCCLRVSRRRG